MLLLTLTCLRAEISNHEISHALTRGDLKEAVRIGLAVASRDKPPCNLLAGALGQVVGRVLLLMGKEEQAEEVFLRQHRVYEGVSRANVRWMSALDQGVIFMHLGKAARAADAFSVSAEDISAPVAIRIEALAGLALALGGVGEHQRASRTLQMAIALAQESWHLAKELLMALQLELMVLEKVRDLDGSLLSSMYESVSIKDELSQRIKRSVMLFAGQPLAVARLKFLLALWDGAANRSSAMAIMDELLGLRQKLLLGEQDRARIDALLVFVANQDETRSQAILDLLLVDERQITHHRYALELQYSLSRVYTMKGRHIEALRLYRQYAALSNKKLRADLSKLPYSHQLEKEEIADGVDSIQLQLPLRYRKAYHFIIQNLNDPHLSVKQVAAHINVTERALQMAFRTHIGVTPAELVRRRRVECIREELHKSHQHLGVLEVASRWGMTVRSTLAQNYRAYFDEVPSGAQSALAKLQASPA